MKNFQKVREVLASIPGDISNDAVGANVAKLSELYAPQNHAAALDPATPIVIGSRGSGKSFWSSVLGQKDTKGAAARAYPKLGLDRVEVHFGYTGVGGPDGISADLIDACLSPEADINDAKCFWWATILSAAARADGVATAKPLEYLKLASNWSDREAALGRHEQRFKADGKSLLVVFDALDTVARVWPRRRLLTEALLEVVWAMRAYRNLHTKLFLRPDQIDDDALRFVELPKLRAGSVRLKWYGADLYGLMYSRLMLAADGGRHAFEELLSMQGLPSADEDAVISRRWKLATDPDAQMELMKIIAGPFMGTGMYAYKKGSTYQWPLSHLADAFDEVTPRSFLGLMTSAAQYGVPPQDKVITPEGIRHGLRSASKTRVDQLQQEFAWIKGVIAPLAGLLLPAEKSEVYKVWQRANTVNRLIAEAEINNYLSPFPMKEQSGAEELFLALEGIGVMFRRRDNRLDMPDLFRVAAKLLKKGAIAPK